MRLVQVQFASWDKKYNFDPVDLALNVGDQVIVKTELGVELGKIVSFIDLPAPNETVKEAAGSVDSVPAVIKKIIRKAVADDFLILPDQDDARLAFKSNQIVKCKLQEAGGYHHCLVPIKLVEDLNLEPAKTP